MAHITVPLRSSSSMGKSIMAKIGEPAGTEYPIQGLGFRVGGFRGLGVRV